MLEKLISKIERSYITLLNDKIHNKEKEFSLFFELPKMTIKGNERMIDTFQGEIVKLSQKHNGIILNTIKTQKGTMIDSIYFDSLDNYLHFLGYKKHYGEFCKILENIYFSHLGIFLKRYHFDVWLGNNINSVYENKDKWQYILLCVEYFLQNTRSNLYLRELPIEVSSKFIENNKKILESILDFLAGEMEISYIGNSLEEKFGIKNKPLFIRFRFLDHTLKQDYFDSKIDDISLRIDDFTGFHFDMVKNIYIVENEINYLTFPNIKDSIIIWGSGFQILHLKDISFFHTKNIFYFGDIDSHGFKILALFRFYYPHTKSICMDRKTFDSFESFVVSGKALGENECEKLKNSLCTEEKELFEYVNKNFLRLEQENITHSYITKYESD